MHLSGIAITAILVGLVIVRVAMQWSTRGEAIFALMPGIGMRRTRVRLQVSNDSTFSPVRVRGISERVFTGSERLEPQLVVAPGSVRQFEVSFEPEASQPACLYLTVNGLVPGARLKARRVERLPPPRPG